MQPFVFKQLFATDGISAAPSSVLILKTARGKNSLSYKTFVLILAYLRYCLLVA